MSLAEQLAQQLKEESDKARKIRDGSANRQQFLILKARGEGFGSDVEAYIKHLKSGQESLQPKGFWDYPDPANALGTTEEGLNPKPKETSITLPHLKKRARTTFWDKMFDPENRK